MYSTLEMLILSFTIGLTGALAPGPTLVATVNSSLKGGWISGPKVAMGHAAVEMVVFLFILQGAALAAESHARAISVVGGLALIAFGGLTIKGSSSASMTGQDWGGVSNPYLAGALTSAANPYFWIWWLSIGGAMVLEGLRGGLAIACLFMIGHWGADFGWYTVVSASISKGKKLLSEGNYRRVLAACGAFLILFGFYYLIGV
jgi:threonine/homoserine/homoserine lactone efflux protein